MRVEALFWQWCRLSFNFRVACQRAKTSSKLGPWPGLGCGERQEQPRSHRGGEEGPGGPLSGPRARNHGSADPPPSGAEPSAVHNTCRRIRFYYIRSFFRISSPPLFTRPSGHHLFRRLTSCFLGSWTGLAAFFGLPFSEHKPAGLTWVACHLEVLAPMSVTFLQRARASPDQHASRGIIPHPRTFSPNHLGTEHGVPRCLEPTSLQNPPRSSMSHSCCSPTPRRRAYAGPYNWEDHQG